MLRVIAITHAVKERGTFLKQSKDSLSLFEKGNGWSFIRDVFFIKIPSDCRPYRRVSFWAAGYQHMVIQLFLATLKITMGPSGTTAQRALGPCFRRSA